MIQKLSKLIDSLDRHTAVRNAVDVLFFPTALVYMEILAKLRAFGELFDGSFHYLFFLSLAMGFLLSGVSMLLSGKPRRLFYIITLALLAVWYSFHITYFSNFNTFFSWQTLGQAKDVTEFWREALAAAAGVWYIILAFFVPLIVFCSLEIFIVPDGVKKSFPLVCVSLFVFMLLFFLTLSDIGSSKVRTDEYTPFYYYTYIQNDLDQSYRYYGIFNTSRLDIKQLIFGAPVEKLDLDSIEPSVVEESHSDDSQKTQEYDWNMMDIDFDKAAASTNSEQLKTMDQYFKSLSPTRKNQYTGLFEGKNLVMFTLEGFSYRVIDPEFTPLLYKMSTEGFVFNNFYVTMWGGSTASGEYSNMTGNFYTTANCLELSAKTYQPFVLGNQLKSKGYKTIAYHNNDYTYYNRHKSHPNFGYKWKAVGHGLTLKKLCWPNSDLEMAEASVGDYASLDQPFHAYYMSFSGHAGYTFSGNIMSKRHKKDLLPKHKSLSSTNQAYLACQYEVELMLQEIVDKLDKAGKLNDTVFALTADHYPYPLGNDLLSELYDLPASGIRNNSDLYRNSFILWSPSMTQPIVVDKPCSTIDILPTLSNLFNLEYDSRLMMGSDILAEGDHFALLKINGWSWISTQGEYYASKKLFVPNADCKLSADEQKKYVKRMNAIVRAKTTYSKLMLDKDYYGHIFGKK